MFFTVLGFVPDKVTVRIYDISGAIKIGRQEETREKQGYG